MPVQPDQEIATASTQKSGSSSIPTVTTNAATTITSATATSGGSVSSSGGGNQVTERGICYNTSPNPRITNNKVPSGSGPGDFVSILSGLAANTTYYVRAYAIYKSNITIYGNQVVFTTLQNYGTVTDFDGNVYNTITIGAQVWTVQNLKTTHYRNGTAIPNVTDNAAWAALSTGAYCNYNNDVANVATYGRLYNWYAATDANNIAPAGWHLPSYNEWQTLINYLGGLDIAGGKAKETGLIHWLAPNEGADNSSGFTSLPAGSRYYIYPANGNPERSSFLHLGYSADWWTSTTSINNPQNAPFITNEWYNTYMYRSGFVGGIGYYDKRTGYSVRLVKD